MTTVPTLTAPEGESLRETIARFLWDTRYGQLPDALWNGARQLAKAIPDGAAASAVDAIWGQADALLSGPLAQLQADLIAARASADEGWQQATLNQDAELVDYRRAEAAEANLIALAKMYGEACGELAKARCGLEECAELVSEYAAAAVPEGMEILARDRDKWFDAAQAAEAERDSLRIRLQEAERALKPFAEICDAEHMRFVRDEQVLELSTRADVIVSEKLRGCHFRGARAALALPLPNQTQETGDHVER